MRYIELPTCLYSALYYIPLNMGVHVAMFICTEVISNRTRPGLQNVHPLWWDRCHIVTRYVPG